MPHKGYKQTVEHRKRLSEAKVGKYVGDKHPQWKGDNASYRAIHKWAERKFGTPRKCEECSTEDNRQHRVHWANVSGKYLRERSDWKRLCSRCHGAFDALKRKKPCI